jgi:O-antigen/teichoic acid export membrane protein
VKYQTYVQHILQPLLMLGLTVVFYLLGAQIFGAVVAYVLSMVAGSILALYYLKRIFPNLSNRNVPPQFESRALFSVAVPMSVVGLARWGNQWGVITVVGILATAEDVGIYNAAAGTGSLSVMVLAAFSGIFSPIVASLYSRGLLDDLSLLYQDVSRWIFAGSLAIFLLTILLAKDIMSIFGDDFVSGWPAMALLSAAQLFNCSVGPTNRILAMTGHQRIYMVATLSSTVVGLSASVVLVPLYGILGAAIAMAAGIVLFNVIAVLFVRRLLGVWPYNRHWPKLLVAGSVAAAATLLARLALPLPYGLPTILVISPVFLMTFVVSVLILGLSVSDREVLKALWTAVRRAVQREA